MTTSSAQLICFDLGGVLVRICEDWQALCERIGIPVPEALAGRSIWRHKPELFEGFEVGAYEEDEFYQVAGEAIPQVGAVNLRRIYESWLLGMYNGAAVLLVELDMTGVNTACFSNTNATHWRQLDSATGPYAPLQRLNQRWASHLAQQRKPNTGAFEFVEQQANLSGEQIVFFDDNTANIVAAKKRGWRATQIDPADPVPQLRQKLVELGVL